MAGREVGRQPRFLPRSSHGGEAARKRRERESERLSALAMLLMRDPEYAALYDDTMDKLRAAELATEAALGKAADSVAQTKDDLDDFLARASVLPDGTRVFRAADGTIHAEDGRLVDDDEAEGIYWHNGAPSHEDFLTRKKAADQARASYDTILRYQTEVLGRARDRLADEEAPPSKEELAEIQKLIEEQQPAAVRAEAEPATAPSGQDADTSFSSNLPKL